MTATSTVTKPLWRKITLYGCGAVLFTSAAIGGVAWYEQRTLNDKALYNKAASDLQVIQTDMDAIQRSATALALVIAGEPDTPALIASNDRQGLINKLSKI